MATFTRLDDGDLAAVASAFDLGEVVAWEAIAAGTINSNYALETDHDRYFVRVNEDKSEEDVRYEAELTCHLAAAGVPTPPPLQALAGERFTVVRDRFVSVFPWLRGRHLAPGEVGEAEAAQLGAALARLHVAGVPLAARFERAGIYTFDDIVSRYEGFRDTGDAALGDAVRAIGEEIAWQRDHAALRVAAPRGVIHQDLFRDNVLFDDTRGAATLVALIDFEQAVTGALVYDLAVCLNDWAWRAGDGAFDAAVIAALIGGYEEVRALEPSERGCLLVCARAAAMRFTVTRITDVYLRGVADPAKDFRAYLARLRRWRTEGTEILGSFASDGASV